MAAAPPGGRRPGAATQSTNAQRLQNELTEAQKADLAEAFRLLDADGVNSIQAKDLKVALRALGYEPQKDRIKKIISDIDKESMSNTILADDFEKIMKAKLFEHDDDEITYTFPLFSQGNDFITLEDLKRVAVDLGENLNDDVLEEMIREADILDHDGRISKEEFMRIMHQDGPDAE